MREAEPFQGSGTALLVDDEDIVRLSTADMLGSLGYRVVEAKWPRRRCASSATGFTLISSSRITSCRA